MVNRIVSGLRVQPGHLLGGGQIEGFLDSSEDKHSPTSDLYIKQEYPALHGFLGLESWWYGPWNNPGFEQVLSPSPCLGPARSYLLYGSVLLKI